MYKFCDGNINKFVMLLRKAVIPYEYMDSWEKCNETLIPTMKIFCSELTLEDISDKDCEHAQKVFKEYCADIGDYHDFMFKLIHFGLQMFLKNLEKNALKYMGFILRIFILNLD